VRACLRVCAMCYTVHSSFFDRDGPPPVLKCVLRNLLGLPVGHVPYTLADMSDDAVGVLDACGVQRAHVVCTHASEIY